MLIPVLALRPVESRFTIGKREKFKGESQAVEEYERKKEECKINKSTGKMYTKQIRKKEVLIKLEVSCETNILRFHGYERIHE